MPPYVPREIDSELRGKLLLANQALQTGRRLEWQQRLIVVGGAAKTGKTRSLLQALGRFMPDWGLAWIRLARGDSPPLRQFHDYYLRARQLGYQPGTPGIVVVLDDLHQHVSEHGRRLELTQLRNLLADPYLIVVATCHMALVDADPDDRLNDVDPALLRWLANKAIKVLDTFTVGEQRQAEDCFQGEIARSDLARLPDPTGKGRQRWMNRWKPVLNAFAITFEGRISPTTTNDTDATYTARLTLPVNGS